MNRNDDDDFEKIRCARCTIEFWITTALYDRRYKDGEIFYCPIGHQNVFTPKEEPKGQLIILKGKKPL